MPFFRYVTEARLAHDLAELQLNAAGNSKSVKNGSGASIAINKAVAWLDNGTITLASAQTSSVTDVAGITLAAIANGVFGNIAKGGNVPGVLAGMSATPGQDVFLGNTPGEITLTAPTGNSSIIKLGRAEPAPGSPTGQATDLFFAPEEIAGI